MATAEAIGLKRAIATERLQKALAAVNILLTIEGEEFPLFNRDTEMLRAQQLEYFAGWAEKVAISLGAGVQDLSEYHTVPVDDLVGFIARRDQAGSIGTPTPEQIAETEKFTLDPQYDYMTIPQLLKIAETYQVDLTGAKRKLDFVEKLKATNLTPAQINEVLNPGTTVPPLTDQQKSALDQLPNLPDDKQPAPEPTVS